MPLRKHWENHVTILFWGKVYPFIELPGGPDEGLEDSTHPKILQIVDTDMHPLIVIRTSLETQMFYEFYLPRWHFFEIEITDARYLRSIRNKQLVIYVKRNRPWPMILMTGATFTRECDLCGCRARGPPLWLFLWSGRVPQVFFAKRGVRGGNIKDSWWRILCKNRACKV